MKPFVSTGFLTLAIFLYFTIAKVVGFFGHAQFHLPSAILTSILYVYLFSLPVYQLLRMLFLNWNNKVFNYICEIIIHYVFHLLVFLYAYQWWIYSYFHSHVMYVAPLLLTVSYYAIPALAEKKKRKKWIGIYVPSIIISINFVMYL